MRLIRDGINLTDTQVRTKEWMLNNEKRIQCGALAHSVGIGKTLCALSLTCTDAKTHDNPGTKDLYITPPGLLQQWKFEMERLTLLKGEIFWKYNELTLQRLIDSDCDIIYVSYYLFLSVPDDSILLTHQWNRVFADEAHILRNPLTLISQKLMLLHSKYRWAISGTFLINTPLDLFGICKFLRCAGHQSKRHFEKELRTGRLVKTVMIQSTPEDIQSLELKEKIETIQLIEMTPEEYDLYNGIKRDARRKMINGKKKEAPKILELINSLRLAASDISLVQGLQLPAQQKCSSQVKELLKLVIKIRRETPQEKILIFSSLLSVINNYKEWLQKIGQRVLIYTGNISRTEREEIIEAFKSDTTNKYPILILGIMCANSGLNLQCATHVFMIGSFWNRPLEAQCCARAYRKGQQKPVYVYYLICKNTIDEKIYKMATKKDKAIQKLLSKGVVDQKVASSLSVNEMKELLDINA